MVKVITLALVTVFVGWAGESAWTMLAPLIFGGAILAFARESGVISQLFRSTAFVRLGDWSYSLVLVAIVARLVETKFGISLMQPMEVDRSTIKLMTIGGWTAMDLAVLAYLATVVGVAAVTYNVRR